MKSRIFWIVLSLVVVCGGVGFGVWWFMFKEMKQSSKSPQDSIWPFVKSTSKKASPKNETETEEAINGGDVKLPWLVALLLLLEENDTKVFLCGGSLISKSHVLAGKIINRPIS